MQASFDRALNRRSLGQNAKAATPVLALSALALMLGLSAAQAQSRLVGTEALNDRIDDIAENAQDDLENAQDAARFGPEHFRQGWSGTMALTYSGASGNTDTQNAELGGRLRYGAGPWTHTFGFGVEYSEDDGTRTERQIYTVYEAAYALNESFYVFGMGRAQHDDFAALEKDAFVGFGPGWRILNSDTTAWRLQFGPGARYTKDQLGNSETELAGIGSSRFFHAFNETVYLTNDTDILYSDEGGTTVSNDLGVNYRMTDLLSTRVSLRTDYNSEVSEGVKHTDNRLGLSLIMGF